MNTNEIAATLTDLFGELVDGPPTQATYMLNRGDVGLVRSLDKLTSREASSIPNGGGSSIAAHVDHLRYGLSLMNRWARGEKPFETADWGESWKKTTVSDTEWQQLRTELSAEAHRWLDILRQPREVQRVELNGIIGSIAHLAYHLGAIRQIDRAARGPADPGR
jgi:hypothetical protein